MGIMKAIIPVAGAGTKLRPHTYTQPKALIPLAGKTVLSVIIDQLIENGVQEFIFIIGYLGEKIQNYVEVHYPEIKSNFVHQENRKGTGPAILLAKELVQNEEVIIVFGDTICELDFKDFIESKTSCIGLHRVDNPGDFGVAQLNKKNRVLKVVEKPKMPKSNLAIVGIYKIIESALMFQCIEKNLKEQQGQDGEYHFTRALQKMIDKGVEIKGVRVKNWFDCGKKETLLETNSILLKKDNKVISTSSENMENTIIIPPVRIGKNCTITNAIIGPSVSVGDNSTISNAIIKNSIIGSFSTLDEVVLKNSVIGSDVYIHGLSQSLNIGDNTEIDLR